MKARARTSIILRRILDGRPASDRTGGITYDGRDAERYAGEVVAQRPRPEQRRCLLTSCRFCATRARARARARALFTHVVWWWTALVLVPYNPWKRTQPTSATCAPMDSETEETCSFLQDLGRTLNLTRGGSMKRVLYQCMKAECKVIAFVEVTALDKSAAAKARLAAAHICPHCLGMTFYPVEVYDPPAASQ